MNQSTSSHHAAVMVLYEVDTDSLVLTERSALLKNHPGEICFPGGRWQSSDVNYYHTAQRELSEEMGISRDRLLDPRAMETEMTLTGFVIHPWFARIETIEPYQLDPNEVVAVHRAPMHSVKNRHHYKKIIVERNGFKVQTIQYTINELVVWGATARIMMQLVPRQH